MVSKDKNSNSDEGEDYPDELPDSSFAPDDPLDQRNLGEWKSKYSNEARSEQLLEAAYLAFLFVFSTTLSVYYFWCIGNNLPFTYILGSYHDVDYASNNTLSLFSASCLSFVGGLLGGTLFSTKWLYHSIAKLKWHKDRRFWRFITPWVSAGLSMGVLLLSAGKLINIFDPSNILRPATSFGIGFFVGYFSDSALGKLADLAKTLFGSTEKHGPPDSKNNDSKSAK